MTTTFLILLGDGKWFKSVALSDAVMFGAAEVTLLQSQMVGLGESAAVLDDNRSHGSNEDIGVRVKI